LVTFETLPVLVGDAVRLREVDVSDAAALTALFQLPLVAAHLDPPPATPEDFAAWISISQARRADGQAACYTLLTGKDEVSGLFMALRLDEQDPNAQSPRVGGPAQRAEIGFALAPHLWGTGVFMQAMDLYLDFLFTHWGVTRLIGKTSVLNHRGVGAMRKIGARVLERTERNGVPEFVWALERGRKDLPNRRT
jgi:RimJ/RimL family protein N-acetyltransferase